MSTKLSVEHTVTEWSALARIFVAIKWRSKNVILIYLYALMIIAVVVKFYVDRFKFPIMMFY